MRRLFSRSTLAPFKKIIKTISSAQLALAVIPNVVFYTDSRHEILEITDPKIHALAQASVAIVHSSHLSLEQGSYQSDHRLFGIEYQLCPQERFFDQTILPFCSGSLIAKDLILTASHCVGNDDVCADTYFVFDFALKNDPSGQKIIPEVFSKSQVYKCKKIIRSEMTFDGADYAILQTDRPILDRTPVILDTSSDLQSGTPIFMLGYPSGLPLKLTDEANITDFPSKGTFRAQIDAFGGNSGSPIFDAKSLKVIGILTSGMNDFNWIEDSCRVVNQCNDNFCYGEEISRTSSMNLSRP